MIIEKDDSLLDLFNGIIYEDVIPLMRYVYKTKNFRTLEKVSKEILEDFLGKKFHEQKRTFDRSKFLGEV